MRNARLERAKVMIREEGLDGLIIGPGPNLTYLTGVRALLTERPLVLFITPGGNFMLTPVLEEGLFKQLDVPLYSYTDEDGVQSALGRMRDALNGRVRWGVEGCLPFRFIYSLQKNLSIQVELADRLVFSLREIKEPEEIYNINRAAEILRGPLVAVAENVKVGVSERALESEMRRRLESEGAHSIPDVLIQVGANSANPHGLPGGARARDGDPVLIDVVCTFSGYHADITRTVCVGENRKFESMYKELLAAELMAVSRVAPGVTTGEVDRAARERLAETKLDRHFIHRTGHGLGLEVHEAPFIVPGGRDVLKPNMVHTIEPGVYLPGEFGVRIEDDVVVTSNSRSVLTRVPTDLGWWTG